MSRFFDRCVSFCKRSFKLVVPGVPLFTWTPLITSGDFTGIQTDVLTVASGIIGLMIIVVALGILVAVFTRH